MSTNIFYDQIYAHDYLYSQIASSPFCPYDRDFRTKRFSGFYQEKPEICLIFNELTEEEKIILMGFYEFSCEDFDGYHRSFEIF